MPGYFHSLGAFYIGLSYGILELLVPVLLWAIIVALAVLSVSRVVKFEVGAGAAMVFVLSFALVGNVTGVIAGATLESIVGAALAAIMTLVSSLLAYLFSKDALQAWRTVIPLAMIGLMTSTLVGLVIGGAHRVELLNQNIEIEKDKVHFEKVTVPRDLETETLLVRKCIAENDYDTAKDKCDP